MQRVIASSGGKGGVIAPHARRWVLLAVFSAVGFAITASTYASLGVVLPAMVRDEHWSWTVAGFGFTLLGAATGASSFLPTVMIRRLGVRATLLGGAAVMACGFACLASARGFAIYFLGSALCGVGYQMAALIPATHVLAALFRRRRAMAFGVYFTVSSLGGVGGPLLVLSVMRAFHDDWRVFWLIQMAASLGLGAIAAALVGGREHFEAAVSPIEAELEAETPVKRRIHRTAVDWTVRQAVRTPQFYVLLAAYFGHLLVGIAVASLSVAHLTQRGVAPAVAAFMLSIESGAQTGGRALGGLVGDWIDPRHLLVFATGCLAVGALALSVADSYPTMILYALGSGLGFGITALAVTMLLLDYYGREHNLEIFSLTCMVGTVSAFAPAMAGFVRDRTGAFGPAFQLFAAVIALVALGAVLMRPPRLRTPQNLAVVPHGAAPLRDAA